MLFPYVPAMAEVEDNVKVPLFDMVASPLIELNEGLDPVSPKSSCPFDPAVIPVTLFKPLNTAS